jgi:hypothetical protein
VLPTGAGDSPFGWIVTGVTMLVTVALLRQKVVAFFFRLDSMRERLKQAVLKTHFPISSCTESITYGHNESWY